MTTTQIADEICKLIDIRTDLISLQCFEPCDDRACDIIDLDLRITELQLELYY